MQVESLEPQLNQQGNVRHRGINKDAVRGLYPDIEYPGLSSFTFSLVTLPILPVRLLRKRGSQINAMEAASASHGQKNLGTCV